MYCIVPDNLPMDSRSHLWYCEVVDRRNDPASNVSASLQLGFHLDGHLPARDYLRMGGKRIRAYIVGPIPSTSWPAGRVGGQNARTGPSASSEAMLRHPDRFGPSGAEGQRHESRDTPGIDRIGSRRVAP